MTTFGSYDREFEVVDIWWLIQSREPANPFPCNWRTIIFLLTNMAPVRTKWTRLIRFVAVETAAVHIGEPVDPNLDGR